MGKNKSGEIFGHILRKLLIELIIPTDIAVGQPLRYSDTLDSQQSLTQVAGTQLLIYQCL